MTKIEWPERQVMFRFYHPTCGDSYFCHMIAAAMQEYTTADPDGSLEYFTASNGVQIKIYVEASNA